MKKVSSQVSQIACIANTHGEEPQGCVWWGKVEIQRLEKCINKCTKKQTELIRNTYSKINHIFIEM